jgi:hypothetical protein
MLTPTLVHLNFVTTPPPPGRKFWWRSWWVCIFRCFLCTYCWWFSKVNNLLRCRRVLSSSWQTLTWNERKLYWKLKLSIVYIAQVVTRFKSKFPCTTVIRVFHQCGFKTVELRSVKTHKHNTILCEVKDIIMNPPLFENLLSLVG